MTSAAYGRPGQRFGQHTIATCIPLVAIVLLAGCASHPRSDAVDGPDDPVVASGVDRDARLTAFSVCHGYGCAALHLVGLNRTEERQLRALFEPVPSSAAEERMRIASAIAYLEQVVGLRLGTSADRPRTPYNAGDLAQLDCVDESINTSTYLHLLKHAGLLHWHRIADPARRYRWLNLGVHFSAVIEEYTTGEGGDAFAVDSWFHANGEPPAIIDLSSWRSGWTPTH